VLKRGAFIGAVAALALTLAPTALAAPPGAGKPSVSIKRFAVHGVYTREQRSMLVAEGYDIGEAYWANHVELYGTAQQARRLMLRGFRVTSKPLPPHGGFSIPDDFPPGFEAYHNYAEMTATLQSFAATHPQFVHLITLGNSYENRNIIGVRISNDANDNLSEPGVFFVGQHHAREHMTVEVTLGLVKHFIMSSQVAVRSLLYSRQIYIFPSLNPDGSEYDIATGSFRMWRKNRQPNPTAVGTDNNRNYSYRWGCCGGSSGNGGSETYRGTAPLSAPENMRMSDFMVAHPNVTTGISYHTYGNLILYPYGYTYDDLPPDMDPTDRQTFVAMGAEMARTTGYHPQQSSDLYITDGDWNDWMYGALGRYPITIEMDSYGYGFYPPDSFISQTVDKNMAAAVFVASIADCPRRIIGQSCTVGSTLAR
jgi:carboxypeptidase T